MHYEQHGEDDAPMRRNDQAALLYIISFISMRGRYGIFGRRWLQEKMN